MAEYISPQEGHHKEGHFPNTEAALVELHRLVSILLASKTISTYVSEPTGERYDPIFQLMGCEDDEIPRLLLSLAITARVIDDRDGGLFERLETNCGRLQPDTSRVDDEPLTLREACNKIIHTKRIRFDTDASENGASYLNPFVYLFGERGRVPWKASIDVIAFAKAYASCVCS